MFEIPNRNYNSKVLFFGEYGILYGAKAFAMPYKKYSGKFIMGDNVDNRLLEFYFHIKKVNHSLHFKLDLEMLYDQIQKGLTFKSNIPFGYGLGSSGALTAAIYDVFNKSKVSGINHKLLEIKSDLAQIEAFFHGQSSGLDPLVSLLDSPVLFDRDRSLTKIDFQLSEFPYKFCLIDSGAIGNTSDLVLSFLTKLKSDQAYIKAFLNAYHNLSDKAVDALLAYRSDEVFNYFVQLSQFQVDHMNNLINDKIFPLFLAGLENGFFAMKLCGSGGGGVYLAMVKPKISVDFNGFISNTL